MCSREYSKLYTSTTCNITSSYSEHTGCVLDLQPHHSSTVEEKVRLIQSTLTHMPGVRLLLIESIYFRIAHMSLPNDDLRLARAKVLHAQMPENSNRILILRESSRQINFYECVGDFITALSRLLTEYLLRPSSSYVA